MNTRSSIYDAIDSERDYQEKEKSNSDRPDIIPDFHVGDTLSAIQYNLNRARDAWYKEATPYKETMIYLRKIAGLIVQIGEQHTISPRVLPKQ